VGCGTVVLGVLDAGGLIGVLLVEVGRLVLLLVGVLPPPPEELVGVAQAGGQR